MPPRPNRFNLMLSDDELAMLRTLAENRGLTLAAYVRSSLRTAYEEAMSDDPSYRVYADPRFE